MLEERGGGKDGRTERLRESIKHLHTGGQKPRPKIKPTPMSIVRISYLLLPVWTFHKVQRGGEGGGRGGKKKKRDGRMSGHMTRLPAK